MTLLKPFENFQLKEVHAIKGGAIVTGGGTYNKNGHSFTYDSDASTWEPQSMEWTVSYYGIRTCAC